MNDPIVTIAMPVYNMAGTVEKSIQSVINQTYTHWRLLILDDGSIDNLKEVVSKFEDSRIEIIRSNTHLGMGPQLNKSIEMTKSPYVARLDADDEMLPTRLEKQLGFMLQNPTIDLLGTAILVSDARQNNPKLRTFPLSHDELTAKPWNGFLIAHPTWLGKASWFRQWQYRDVERYEDQDLLLRSHKTSQFANLPEALTHYSPSTPSLRKSWIARKNALVCQSTYFFKQKAYFTCLFVVILNVVKLFTDILKKYKIRIC